MPDNETEVDILVVTDPENEALTSAMARYCAPLVLQDLQLGITAEDTPHGRALTAAVYKAVDALEGQGARSNRIALQLLEALARYELALGQLQIESSEPATPHYRVEWCNWTDGFEAHQQEWKPTEHTFTDEYEANTLREGLDARFRTINIRHRVVQVKTPMGGPVMPGQSGVPVYDPSCPRCSSMGKRCGICMHYVEQQKQRDERTVKP